MPEQAIAVIGVSCRLPRAADPSAFWELLRTGTGAITDPPPRRAHDLGVDSTLRAGFLDRIDAFDPAFFGIAPREATSMDPQQRLMLELAWEGLEDAGVVPAGLAGSRTGVFVGAMAGDYATLLARAGAGTLTPHSVLGLTRGIIANRVSYLLDARGPSLTVDAAQSSALVAVHLAVQSLRRGESDLAIAGGVSLIAAAESTLGLERFGALSPDSTCFTFDARANGYVRGEGGAAVVLKPADRAIADGDRIYCLIHGSAVNNDGSTDALTVPSADAQEDVLRRAYQDAGVDPAGVGYVELHGTGTRVGDPIEAAALGAAIGGTRPGGQALRVGSAKTNVGHLEGAAGIVGLLKVALAIRHRELPASLNFSAPNPEIDFAGLNLAVQTETGQWPQEQLLAGVSAFGMGGTNCHVVLGEPAATEPTDRAAGPWLLSARTEAALREQAANLGARLASDPQPHPADVAHTLITGRTGFGLRAAVTGTTDRAAALGALDALAEGMPYPGLVTGRATSGKTAFVFPGQGSQWPAMGQHLLVHEPVFAEHIRSCADIFAGLVDWDLINLLTDPDPDLLQRTDVVQPAVFAVMTGLAQVWRQRGVRPDAVIGHSQGEIAAAACAGILTMPDAATVIILRSAALTELSGTGAMASLQLAESRMPEVLLDGVHVTAVNGPASTVVSGTPEAIEAVIRRCEEHDVRARRIPVSYASHSPAVEPLRERLLTALAGIRPEPGHTDLYSTVTTALVDGTELDAGYWYQNLRRPVRLRPAVELLHQAGHRFFLEVSPHPVLATGIRETLDAMQPAEQPAAVLSTLRRDHGDRFETALAEAQVAGLEIYWQARGELVSLPTYPFQRRRYWLDVPSPAAPLSPVPPLDADPVDADLVDEPVTAAARLAALPTGELAAALTELVSRQVAVSLGHGPDEPIETASTFKDLGFDSALSLELQGRLSAATGLDLPTGLTFNHPTPVALIRFLSSQLAPSDRPVQTAPARTQSDDDPVAIVGMGCRYPGGVRSAQELWELLADGRDAIGPFPTDRGWDLAGLHHPDPAESGTTYARGGGFLQNAAGFDPGFFGVSPREALAMDPQQRLLLELSWETFENARIVPSDLAGRPVGVFVGAMNQDYGPRMHQPSDGLDGYLLTGSTASVLSGRISYTYGFEGPAVTVDTACSSSLVAIHLGRQALLAGECDLAVAGGVTVLSTPGLFVEFSRQRGLAEDGRCKSFSAGADGTGWAEGAGLLVLERLSDARRNGHRVLGLLRGSAVNQDGASNGLTAPNGPAQERVIRTALRGAGLRGKDVDAVEAHGTGTTLGDPIEAQALINTYGQDRPGPFWLGSLKSNIGHTQAAAGVGGVIKMVMALRHQELPRSLHSSEPTPHIDWSSTDVRLLTEPQPWPAGERPRRAAVSSFGISGTNAHLILEEAPGGPPQDDPTPIPALPATLTAPVPCVLSGTTVAAVRAQAVRLRDFLSARPELGPAEIAHELATGRCGLTRRAAVIAADRDDLLTGLEALAEGREHAINRAGSTRGGKLAFLFTGQGSQRPGMGALLHATHPIFAQAFDQAAAALDGHLGEHTTHSLAGILLGADDPELIHWTIHTQPALFALQVGLYRLLESWGVRPDLMAGHSLGEITAAHASGVLDLSDAAALVAARARLMQAVPAQGAMLAIEAEEIEIAAALTGFEGLVSIAAVNTPTSVVISGDEATAEQIAAGFRDRGRRTTRLKVSHAFHSPHIDVVLTDLRAVAEGLTYHRPRIPVVSTVTGSEQADLTDPGYWAAHARQPVRFADAVRRLHSLGVRTQVELGPDPVLIGMAGSTLQVLDPDPESTRLIPTLNRKQPETASLAGVLAEIYLNTVLAPNWDAALPRARTAPELPGYAFQHERFWLSPSAGGTLTGTGLSGLRHPLLAAAVRLPDSDGHLVTGHLSVTDQAWLTDHAIFGGVVFPATGFVEILLQAAVQAGCDGIVELSLETPLVLPDSGSGVRIQIAIGAADESGRRSAGIHSSIDSTEGIGGGDEVWTRHANAVLGSTEPIEVSADPLAGSWPPAGASAVDVETLYPELAARGYEYGPIFQGITGLWQHGDEVFADVRLPAGTQPGADLFAVHPALLDAALQAVVATSTSAEGTLLPFILSEISLSATGAEALRVHVRRTGTDEVRLRAVDPAGAPVVTIGSLLLRAASPELLTAGRTARSGSLGLVWPVLAGREPVQPGRWGVLGPDGLGLPGRSYPDLAALSGAVAAGEPAPDVVLLPLLSDLQDPAATRALTLTAARVLQAWVADDGLLGSRLVLLTRGAVATTPGQPVEDLAVAGIWGLVRVAQSEYPDRFVLLDLDRHPDSVAVVATALATGETQLALRGGEIHAPRLSRSAEPEGTLTPPPGDAWRLDVTTAGTLCGLALVPAPEAERPPAAGEVAVAVRAAGVNFRDVLISLGMYPGDARIGAEGAGVVLAVGPGVDDLAPGDRVMGLTPGIAGSRAVVDRRLLTPIPAGWSYIQAATVPVAFLTAYHALADLAGLKPGERVLIHAATGGVGMAAVQLAQHWGADVYGTASPAKWPTLRAQGLDDTHIASSRTLDFETGFRAAAGWVDVVLNALAHEFTDASLRLLGSGGRFVEMGKTDVRTPQEVALDRPGVEYLTFDLLGDVPAERIGQMLADLLPLFKKGVLTPLPVTAWDIRQAPAALRHLSQARHTGKLALSVPVPFDPEGTVLISGGTGTLGRIAARRLVTEHGVRHLLVAGRRGPEAPGATGFAAEIRALGAQIEIVAADVADPDDAARMLASIDPDHPLTAVVHTAGVVDDATLTALSAEQLERTFRPKVDAAYNLHRLTAGADLSAFLLYSSVAGVLGTPGQCGYAAANTYLDALAQQRRAQGLPGTSLAWGYWAEASGITGHLTDSDVQRMVRIGIVGLPVDTAVEMFDAALFTPSAVLVPARVDAAGVARRTGEVPTMLRGLVRAPARTAASAPRPGGPGGPAPLAERLAGRSEAEQDRLLLDLVRRMAAAVLGHTDPEQVDPDRGFLDSGFDSLTVVEFRNHLAIATGLRLPATLLINYPDPGALSRYLRAEIAPAPVRPGAQLLARIEDLQASLGSMSVDGDEHTAIATRLQQLLSSWNEVRADETQPSGPEPDIDLEAATDEELFATLNELGIPDQTAGHLRENEA